jgi:hypothetical protein
MRSRFARKRACFHLHPFAQRLHAVALPLHAIALHERDRPPSVKAPRFGAVRVFRGGEERQKVAE